MELKYVIASLVFFGYALTGQPLNQFALRNTNSPYDELNPVLTPDGGTLFFTIANHPQNLGGKKDPGDIWYAVKEENGQWSSPKHAGALLNDRAFNGVAGFSEDGNELFLLSHYGTKGNLAATQGISVARKAGDNDWSAPENISIPYFQNKSSIVSGFVSPDKSVFIFSAETYGSYGVEDIYVSLRNSDGKWTAPRNLGPSINTQFQEVTPSLSPDGKTLFFSTNGKKGKGSFDVFSASRLDDSWTNWSDPVNLGTVNTEGRDLFYRDYSSYGFSLYTSTKNSDGYGDIRTWTPPVLPEPTDSVIVAKVPATPVPQKNNVVTPVVSEEAVPAGLVVKGKVVDTRTGESIAARITISGEGVAKSTSVSSGPAAGYSSVLDRGKVYSIRIEAPGYISSMERLDVRTIELRDLEMNFRLQPIEVGATVNLKSVLFEQSKTKLLPESFTELDLVVNFLKENPTVSIELAGHTDNRGNPFQNVKLSQSRVDVVRRYLVEKGIDGDRITGKGHGGSKPIASNNSEDTRKLNRRVEFTIKGN